VGLAQNCAALRQNCAALRQEGDVYCAEHARKLGGESPLPNLMEVKG